MQIVIDIPNEAYNEIVNNVVTSYRKFSSYEMDNCIKNGTPLPKGHGRLIDADALNFADIDSANHGSNYIRIAPTIIDADTESEVNE